MIEEKITEGSVDPVNLSSTEKILDQMKNCICKIKIDNMECTGFFCKIPDINMNCLMTSNQLINEEYINENKEITLLLNEDKEQLIIDLEIKRIKYFNKEYDITIIELKEEDKIKEYLELDDNIFKDDEKIYYEKKSIYLLQYIFGKNLCVSYGILNKINNYDIIHVCSTDNGSSGSPILNLENKKVVGIHKQDSFNVNSYKGTLLKYPLNDFIKKYNENKIIAEITINKDDINKEIQIINSYENYLRKYPFLKINDEYKNENEIKENIEIKINGKIIEFTYKYKFKEEGKYEIDYLFKNNLTKTCYMFFDCNSLINLNLSNFKTENVVNMRGMFSGCNTLINLDLSNFNTENVINMSDMFSDCKSLTNLNLSNLNTKNVNNMRSMFCDCNSLTDLNLSKFNTENVTNMSNMFYGCNSLTNLNLSNFNTENVSNMSNMFYGCKSLTNLNLSNFNTKNVTNMDGMFYECKPLIKMNLISKDNKILTEFEY